MEQKTHPPTQATTVVSEEKLLKKIRTRIVIFIIFLVLSGITAFPIQTEMGWVEQFFNWLGVSHPLIDWLYTVVHGVEETYAKYPFIAYGTDWLAFAHLVIAVVFIGPWRDPVRNIWVLQFGLIACVMVFPLAWIAGPIREIPALWRLGDSLFGIFGFLLMWRIYRQTKQLETWQRSQPAFT